MQEGALTFLFNDDGATSKAAYQLAGSCDASPFARSGALELRYSPASLGNQAIGIESVMSCAADLWLPLVQGRGGISLVVLSDNSLNYELTDGDNVTWLDVGREGSAISNLCE